MRLDRPGLDDPRLQDRVALDEQRVREKRVAECQIAMELVAVRQDVAVDAERGPVSHQRADQHRAAWRPRVGTRLRTEPELAEQRGHVGDVVRCRRDREIDDALARQARDRRAADVLDDEIGAPLADELSDGGRHVRRSWVPGLDRCGLSDVRPDRWLTHSASVDWLPMRQIIGRRGLEVDVG